jgi:hypothetical protein
MLRFNFFLVSVGSFTDMHEGVHEAIIESGIKFMTKWIGSDSNKK